MPKMLKIAKLRKIAKSYVTILNDLDELKFGIQQEKLEEGISFETITHLNNIIDEITRMQDIIVHLGTEKYGLSFSQTPDAE